LAEIYLKTNRRFFIGSAAAFVAGWSKLAMAAPMQPPAQARLILDNDFAGDPDGLFQLAHHLLCKTIQIPLIIGSHFPARFSSGHDAQDSAMQAREILKLLKLDAAYSLIAGAESPIQSRQSWRPSAASAAIVREAMRPDAQGPLIYASGAGLTDLALAWLAEPKIGQRMRLIWIGGNTHANLASAGPGPAGPEFNFSIDPIAAQVLFNESDIQIWQVPSTTYRQMLFSTAELEELGASSPLGAYLKAKVDAVPEIFGKIPGVPPIAATEAYVLGDSPLVTLTALLPPFDPDPTSSRYKLVPTPHLLSNGGYTAAPNARPMRVYTDIDAGLTFRDMLAKFRLFAKAQRSSASN
jgi:hypothetical protein